MNTSNKVVPLRTINTIDNEASIWLVRLDGGNLSDGTRKELKRWLSADTRHPIALKAMTSIWDDFSEKYRSFVFSVFNQLHQAK